MGDTSTEASSVPPETTTMAPEVSSEISKLEDKKAEPKEGEDAAAAVSTTAASGAPPLFDEMTIIAVWTLFCTIRILMYSFGRQFASNFWRR